MDIDLSAARVWEPACGEGHISSVLLEYADDVIATDVFDYSVHGVYPPGWAGVTDFLDPAQRGTVPPDRFDWIITNPPFSPERERDISDKALAFVVEAARIASKGVAVFVRSQWAVEGVNRYHALFSENPPTLMAFFSERVNLCKGKWDPDGGTATAYCWLVWMPDMLPGAPIWIPPGRRTVRSRPDDVERFTAHPVRPPTIETAPPSEGHEVQVAQERIPASEGGSEGSASPLQRSSGAGAQLPDSLQAEPGSSPRAGTPASESEPAARGSLSPAAQVSNTEAPAVSDASGALIARPKGLTAKQRDAFDEAAATGLIRRRDGWVKTEHAYGHHSFQTVWSLVERGVLIVGPDGKRAFVKPADVNQVIRDCYAAEPFPGLPEIALRTGLTENAVKQRAKRMQLGDRERQREAVSRMNAQRRGTGHASHA